MASVIRDVLDLCRSARGCLPAHLERVDLPLVVAGAVAATRPLMVARHHRLTVSIPQRLPTLIAQASRIEQILTNLIDNAAKFTEAGGHVTLTVEPVADAIELRVRDDGTGIAREMLPHVFDSRRRDAASRHRPGAGLGIGLPLVKTLVHLLQGTVIVHSDGPGTGSEFVVRLPTSSPLAPADGQHHLPLVRRPRSSAIAKDTARRASAQSPDFENCELTRSSTHHRNSNLAGEAIMVHAITKTSALAWLAMAAASTGCAHTTIGLTNEVSSNRR